MFFFQAGGQYGQPHTESCLRGDGGHEISVGFFKPQLDSSRGHLGSLSTGFVPHPQSLSSLRFLPALSCRCGCPKSVPRSAASEILDFCPCFHVPVVMPLPSSGWPLSSHCSVHPLLLTLTCLQAVVSILYPKLTVMSCGRVSAPGVLPSLLGELHTPSVFSFLLIIYPGSCRLTENA